MSENRDSKKKIMIIVPNDPDASADAVEQAILKKAIEGDCESVKPLLELQARRHYRQLLESIDDDEITIGAD